MKIIVMDSANVRIEVLNVPDHMIEEDIEQFLAEHDYSLNNISWMAAPIGSPAGKRTLCFISVKLKDLQVLSCHTFVNHRPVGKEGHFQESRIPSLSRAH